MKTSLIVLGLLAGLALATTVSAQSAEEVAQALSRQSLRPYWHVFIAYALAWLLVMGWVVSIARRLGRLERDQDL